MSPSPVSKARLGAPGSVLLLILKVGGNDATKAVFGGFIGDFCAGFGARRQGFGGYGRWAGVLPDSAVQNGERPADKAGAELLCRCADPGSGSAWDGPDWRIFSRYWSGNADVLCAHSGQFAGDSGRGGAASLRGCCVSEGGGGILERAGGGECIFAGRRHTAQDV